MYDSWSGRLLMTYELVSELMNLFSLEDDIDVTNHATYGRDSLLGGNFDFD